MVESGVAGQQHNHAGARARLGQIRLQVHDSQAPMPLFRHQ